MKVILTQTVPGVGEAGTIKEVADGYARNYLLPKKLAVTATRGSVKQAEAQSDLYTRKASKAREAVMSSAGAIQDKTVVIRARAGSENRLYGSVTPADVADALLAQHKITMDRRRIELDEAIHRLGTYTATADFGNGVTAKFNVEVAQEVVGAGSSAKAPKAEASAVTGDDSATEDTQAPQQAEQPETAEQA